MNQIVNPMMNLNSKHSIKIKDRRIKNLSKNNVSSDKNIKQFIYL